jgi:hypothetical protein
MAGGGRVVALRRVLSSSNFKEPFLSEAIQSFRSKILDCFVASAQNCFAILSRAPRKDALVTARLMVRDAASRLLTMRVSQHSDLILRNIAPAMRLEG